MGHRLRVAVVLAVLLSGCQSTPVPSSNVANGSSSTPDTPNPWGPLAVVDDPARDDLDAGAGPGRLVIAARCVTLVVDGSASITLVWRSGQTRWDASTSEIVFQDRSLGVVRLTDGDRLELGGAALMGADSPDQGAAEPVWLVQPAADCPEVRWVVHSVRPARQ